LNDLYFCYIYSSPPVRSDHQGEVEAFCLKCSLTINSYNNTWIYTFIRKADFYFRNWENALEHKTMSRNKQSKYRAGIS